MAFATETSAKSGSNKNSMKKYVYFFGAGQAEGTKDQRLLLGGKGANLAEMTNLGIPVPFGFTISTVACKDFYALEGKWPDGLEGEIEHVEAPEGRIHPSQGQLSSVSTPAITSRR